MGSSSGLAWDVTRSIPSSTTQACLLLPRCFLLPPAAPPPAAPPSPPPPAAWLTCQNVTNTTALMHRNLDSGRMGASSWCMAVYSITRQYSAHSWGAAAAGGRRIAEGGGQQGLWSLVGVGEGVCTSPR